MISWLRCSACYWRTFKTTFENQEITLNTTIEVNCRIIGFYSIYLRKWLMKTPERSHTSRISQVVQPFCTKVLFFCCGLRDTHKFTMWPIKGGGKTQTKTQTSRQTAYSIILTADAGGKNYHINGNVYCLVHVASVQNAKIYQSERGRLYICL